MTEFGGELVQRVKAKMAWHQARHVQLARNVANADTPGFRPADLEALNFEQNAPARAGKVKLVATDPAHIAKSRAGGSSSFANKEQKGFEVVKSGNAVSLEVEMAKVAENQADHDAVSGIYQRMLGIFRLANGRR